MDPLIYVLSSVSEGKMMPAYRDGVTERGGGGRKDKYPLKPRNAAVSKEARPHRIHLHIGNQGFCAASLRLSPSRAAA